MNNKQPNAEESLQIISEMVNKTRRYIESSAHRPFLVWGYTTIAITLLVWYLYSKSSNDMCFWLWFALPILGWLGMYITRHTGKQDGYIRTAIDRTLSHIWVVLTIVALVATISSFLHPIPILFIITITMGAGSAMTGLIIEQQVITIAGFAGIALSLLFLAVQGINQCLIFAIIFFVMMVLPGHILQYRQHKQDHNV